MKTPQQIIGKISEETVCDYLQQQGLKFVLANYQCKCGEIDLIMQDDATLVFVEVRYRQLGDFGDAVSSVTRFKQRRIIRSAICYLLENNLYNKVQCRFDVVGVSNSEANDLRWIKDAFWIKW